MKLFLTTAISKLKILALCTLLISMSAKTANAHKLDPKWTAMRTEANVLGDQAGEGDAKAYMELESRTLIKGSAPFIHNVAWIYTHGYGEPYESIYSSWDVDKSVLLTKEYLLSENYGKTKQSLTIACKLYKIAAEEKYPPSMHAYADLCLRPKARRNHPDAKFMRQARSLFAESAIHGWTNSAVVLADMTWRDKFDLNYSERKELNTVIQAGFDNNPTKSERVKLSYLKAVILNRDIDAYRDDYSQQYQDADIALQFASKQGYGLAEEALSTIRKNWFKKLKFDIHYWYMRMDLDRCVDNIKSAQPDKHLTISCKVRFRITRDSLDNIDNGALYLHRFLSNEQQIELQESMNKLAVKSAYFRANRKTWEDIIVKIYNDRQAAKDSGE